MSSKTGAITRLLREAETGDARAVDRLLQSVYDELRSLAAARLRNEKPGQTLDATALVHEVYLRLVAQDATVFDNRSHFFSAAAEAMRRILVERARRKLARKHGGDVKRSTFDENAVVTEDEPTALLALHAALERFEAVDAEKAALIKLRHFGGLGESQAAEVLGISRATAARHWAYARAWLYEEILRCDGRTV